MILVHDCQYFKTIHLRHGNVQKNQINSIGIFADEFNCLYSIFCFQSPIIFLKHIRQDRTIHLRIIYN